MDTKRNTISSLIFELETAVAAENEVSIYESLDSLRRLGELYTLASIGHLYELGSDRVAKNLRCAFEWYKRAIESEEPDGYFAIARFHFDGIFVERDLRVAAENFREAADRGAVEGKVMLGVCYLRGCGVERDVDFAKNLFVSASKSGYVIAWSFLSLIEFGRKHYLKAAWFWLKCVLEIHRLRDEPDNPRLYFVKREQASTH